MEYASIIIPVYNEEESIVEVITDIIKNLKNKRLKYEIIIIDDGSTDNIQKITSKFNIKYIRHEINKGVGAARKTGIKAAKYDFIVMLDGDGTYPADRIYDLILELKNADMVVGARIKESGTFNLLRKFIKFIIRILASYIAGFKIPDLNSGMRSFKKRIALNFFNILPNTHSWVSTITLCFLCNDYNVKYIPIDYYKRKGKSTFHPIKDTYNYISLVFKTIMYFNPLKIFLPMSLGILIWGIYRTVYHAKFTVRSKILESDIIIIIVGALIGIYGLLADLIVKQFKFQYMDIHDKK